MDLPYPDRSTGISNQHVSELGPGLLPIQLPPSSEDISQWGGKGGHVLCVQTDSSL